MNRAYEYAAFHKRGSSLSHHGVTGPEGFRITDDTWNKKAAELEANRYQRAYDLGGQSRREADAALVEAAEPQVHALLINGANFSTVHLAYAICQLLTEQIRRQP